MRKSIILAVIVTFSSVVHATSTDALIATLEQGDSLQVFTGYYAFVNAYNAAADSGAVITLSPGVFNYVSNIEKQLTLIGAGFESDEENDIYPTVIPYATFRPASSGSHVEGILFSSALTLCKEDKSESLENFSILKCKCNYAHAYGDLNNITVRQSVIVESDRTRTLTFTNVYFVGSYVHFETASNKYLTGSNTIYVDNCVVYSPIVGAATYTNSIIGGTFDGKCTGTKVSHSLLIEEDDYNDYFTGDNNVFATDYDIFEEDISSMEWDDEKTFKLKDPSLYIGNDDTQRGMYGGDYPYNPTPTIPQVTSYTLDTSELKAGTLKVSVTAEAQTEN